MSVVLIACDNDNVNLIFDNIVTWSPQIVGSIDIVLTKLNATSNPFGIIEIEANIPIANNEIFTIIIDGLNNTVLSNIVGFSRNGNNYTCPGDGLLCL